MATIHIKVKTKSLLDSAIKQYCKDKDLNEDLESKISYDFIINEVLNVAGVE